MSCELYRQFTLDHNWDEATRRRAGLALQHLESCAECQNAVQDYDRLRVTLGTFVAEVDPPAGWDEFRPPSESPAADSDSPPPPMSISRLPSRWRFAWTGIAAALVLAASVAFELGQAAARPVSPQTLGGSFIAAHAFSPPEMPDELNQFDQLSNFFDGRLSWMVASNSTSDTGLAAPGPALGRDVQLLRLTLTHGPELTSTADLMIIPGQSAEFTLPGRYGPVLHYKVRTSANNPSQISLALELTSPKLIEPLAALATNLQLQSGEKLTAGRLVTAYGEYELNVSFATAELPAGDR